MVRSLRVVPFLFLEVAALSAADSSRSAIPFRYYSLIIAALVIRACMVRASRETLLLFMRNGRARTPPLHGPRTREYPLLFLEIAALRSQILCVVRHSFDISSKCVKFAFHAYY